MEIVASQTNHLVPGAHFVPDSHHHYYHHHHHLNLIPSLLVLCSIWSRALAVTTTQQHNREQVTNFGHPSETDDDGSSKLATMFGEPHHHEDASAESNAGWMHGNSAGHDHDHDVTGELGTDNQQPDRTLLSNENEMYNHHHHHHDGNFSSENDEPSESRSRKRLPNIQTQAPTMDGGGGGGTVWKEFLTSSLAEEACKLDRGCQRRDRLNDTYLNYCNRYKLENLFSSQILMSIMHDTTKRCQTILAEFIQLDDLINHFYGLFEKLLTRYNCHNGYSVKWTCEDCKKAYQDWLCATSLPYYMNGYNIKPCISFCERVEQRCPYLHPTVKEQYGGQPVFICRDPNIPFVKAITHDIPYEEPSKCYDLCHLSQNRTELFIDSLSKYDPEMCPEPNLLAEKVRNESVYCQMPSGENLGASNQDDSVNVSGGGEVDADVGAVASNGSLSSNRPTSVHIHVKKFAELKDVLEVHLAQQKAAKNNTQRHSDHR